MLMATISNFEYKTIHLSFTRTKNQMDKIISKCKKGNVLVFPPMWTHPHSGEKPLNKPKYIIGSYLHYV